MADAVSALDGAAFTGAVSVSEQGLRGMITLRGDLASPEMKAAVKGAVGAGVPGCRRIETAAKGSVAWMSSDELLVMVPYDRAEEAASAMREALSATHAMVVNVSDARAQFQITGVGAREVLAKGAPVDLSREAFGAGQIRRTRVGQVAAAFWLSGDETFELVCFRSVAGYMFDWLSVAAAKGSLPGFYT